MWLKWVKFMFTGKAGRCGSILIDSGILHGNKWKGVEMFFGYVYALLGATDI